MMASHHSVPDLTVGLPVYDGEKYLAGAIDSILEQSYGDFLLLISDNASNDSTREICEEFASKDQRILYTRQDTNMGGAWNFNAVADQATSPFFKWVSHDDLHDLTFLERCMESFEDAPDDVILCYPQTNLIDGQGALIEPFDDDLDLRDPTASQRLRRFLDNYKMSSPIFGVIRRSLLARTSMMGSYISADKVLMAEMAMVGQFWEVPGRLFMRRYHEGMSLRANVTPEDIAAWFDPNNPHPVSMTRTKLFTEYARSIASPGLGLSPGERVRCMQSMIASGGIHELHVMAGEIKRETKIGIMRTKNRFLG